MQVDPHRLQQAALAALQPRGLDRLALWVTRGFAPVQLLERLPPELQAELRGDEPNETLARRVAIEQLILALDALIQRGEVRRGRARLKNALVDVYRRR